MVVLNKAKLMRNSVYFGTKNVRGSNKKVVNLKGVGLIPFGDNSQTFGVTGKGMNLMGTTGNGMNLMGTGLFSKLKSLAKPLLNKGKNELKKQANSYVNKIDNPLVKKLATTGLATTEKLVDAVMSGNTKLDNLKNITKMGAQQAVKDVVTGKGMRGSKMIQPSKNMAHPLEDSVSSVTDRPFLKNNNNRTESNIQLTLLSDLIKSRPLTTRTIKGSGLYTV